MVPVAGVEPARVISPTDFESASSTNSNTPADIFLYTQTSVPRNLEGYAGGMWKTDEKQNLKNAWFSKSFPNTGDRWRRGFWVLLVYQFQHTGIPLWTPCYARSRRNRRDIQEGCWWNLNHYTRKVMNLQHLFRSWGKQTQHILSPPRLPVPTHRQVLL